MIVLAFLWRKRYPIASYGFFLALILLAPTSSIMPIKDAVAERRLYLPFIGFALMACEVIVRSKMDRKALAWTLAAVCLLFGFITYQRNAVWLNMETLWQDVVDKNPENPRALMGLANAYALGGNCVKSVPYFERSAELQPNNYQAIFNLGSAYECSNQNDKAIAAFKRALMVEPKSEAWAHIALAQVRKEYFDDALGSLEKAEKLDSFNALVWNLRGAIYLERSRFDDAAAEFQKALAANPNDPKAARGLASARRHATRF
jgi:tetratricopeptide (TPR) repeat protein